MMENAMTKVELLAALDEAKAACASLPVSGPLVAWLIERLSAGDPALWTAIAPAWAKRQFPFRADAWMLLLNGLHAEMIRRPDKPLGRFFPTCRGTPGDLRAALDQELDAPSKELVDNLSKRSRQYYEKFWATLWQEHALSFFHRRPLGYYVAEIGTIGGLHAVSDLLARNAEFDSARIAGRVGFAELPLRLETAPDRAWLLGACFPETAEHFKAVDAAIEGYRGLLKSGESPIELIDCDPFMAVKALGANLKPQRSAGLLVLTTWITRGMSADQFARFRGDMETLFSRWQDRALWLELVAAPGGRPGIDFRLGGYRMGQKGLVGQPLARFEMTPKGAMVMADHAANRAFLS